MATSISYGKPSHTSVHIHPYANRCLCPHLLAQLVPLLEEGCAGHVAVVFEARPGLLADGEVHVFHHGRRRGLALGVVEHVVVHAAVRLERAGRVRDIQKVVRE